MDSSITLEHNPTWTPTIRNFDHLVRFTEGRLTSLVVYLLLHTSAYVALCLFTAPSAPRPLGESWVQVPGGGELIGLSLPSLDYLL